MKQHFYLKALKIGFDYGDTGISLNDINVKLKKSKYDFNDDLFRDWYYRNFEHKGRITFSNKPIIGVSESLDDVQHRLSSDSLFQYIEYIELEEARSNSLIARKESKNAFYIAILSLAVSAAALVGNLVLTQNVSERTIQNQLKELNKIISENQIHKNSLHQESIKSLKSQDTQVEHKNSK